MACACNKKNRVTASGTATVNGTYRVMAGERKVYETTNPDAAATVAKRFDEVTVIAPDGKKTPYVKGIAQSV